ncbi:MAG: metal-dependent hydrolase, partial [Bacteroidetes bacterium]
MDSLTQIVLGAAVGEATLGKKQGGRAALWGAIGGTIPDLDVIAGMFQGEFQYLIAHRGVSHSIIFSVLMAPLLGRLIFYLYRGQRGSPREWSWLMFWALFTHPLLDSFTTWGTQLFYPFSDYRVAFNSIFVIDPLYTLPFAICLLVALSLPRTSLWRQRWNWAGIVISSLYLLLTVTNKLAVESVFQQTLHRAGKSVVRLSTYPAPLNNVLWYTVAEEPSGFDVGYYSLLSGLDRPKIDFHYIPKNHQLLGGRDDQFVPERLRWMSKGYYALGQQDSSLLWYDLRFGLLNPFLPDTATEPAFVFAYRLIEEGDSIVQVEQR